MKRLLFLFTLLFCCIISAFSQNKPTNVRVGSIGYMNPDFLGNVRIDDSCGVYGYFMSQDTAAGFTYRMFNSSFGTAKLVGGTITGGNYTHSYGSSRLATGYLTTGFNVDSGNINHTIYLDSIRAYIKREPTSTTETSFSLYNDSLTILMNSVRAMNYVNDRISAYIPIRHFDTTYYGPIADTSFSEVSNTSFYLKRKNISNDNGSQFKLSDKTGYGEVELRTKTAVFTIDESKINANNTYQFGDGGVYVSGNLTTIGNSYLGNGIDTTVLHGSLWLDTTSAANVGVIYKGGYSFIHTFRHPTGSSARPDGKNLLIGKNAGNFTMGSTATSSTQASYNVIMGEDAFMSNTTGHSNVGMGVEVLNGNQTGTSNTAIGHQALKANTQSTNVAIGYVNSYLKTTGNSNTSVGASSCVAFSTGGSATSFNNGVFLGYGVRPYASASTNEVVIGYNAYSQGSNMVTLGNSDITTWQPMRNVTTNTAGTNLLLKSSGATAGSTDKGCMFTIAYGETTGSAPGSLRLQSRTRSATTGTSDNAAIDRLIIPSEKNLTDEGNNDLFEVALASGEMCGGTIDFTIVCGDGTDKQVYKGIVQYAAVDKATVLTTSISETPAISALSTGTLTTVWSVVDGANKITIRVVPTSSLVPTQMKISYTIINGGQQAVTQL